MRTVIKPDPDVRRYIRASIPARIELCYDCSSCLTACPVYLTTGKLRPRDLVRMANFGLLEELVHSPQLWYCLSCGRCNHACPMTVKPAALIADLRREALRRQAVTYELTARIADVHRQLHRVRRRLAVLCLEGQPIPDLSLEWDQFGKPLEGDEDQEVILTGTEDSRTFRSAIREYMGFATEVDSCFTCRQCTNACPVGREPVLFDPLRIFRKVTFGLRDELLSSPTPWLCIDCGTCALACSQKVRGNLVIRRLQQLAFEQDYVNPGFLSCWRMAQEIAYKQFLEKVDLLVTGSVQS
jgi:heterodisulfide reductase subunit C